MVTVFGLGNEACSCLRGRPSPESDNGTVLEVFGRVGPVEFPVRLASFCVNPRCIMHLKIGRKFGSDAEIV